MEGKLVAAGVMLVIISLPPILWPGRQVRDSQNAWNARLEELKSGAPEAYFEERRELEAYKPRWNLSDSVIRRFALATLALGIGLIVWTFVE